MWLGPNNWAAAGMRPAGEAPTANVHAALCARPAISACAVPARSKGPARARPDPRGMSWHSTATPPL